MRCPQCTFPLSRLEHREVEIEHCERCRGSFLDAGEASLLFGKDVEPEAWKEAWPTQDLGPTRRRCPKDSEWLRGHRVSFRAERVEVETCDACGGLWVDAQEALKLKSIVDAAQNEAAQRASGLHKPGIGSYLFQVFTGFPVEAWNPVRHRPVIVHTLLGMLASIFVLQVIFQDTLEAEPGRLMMVPAEVMNGQHLWTLVSSAFLHGGLMHLVGNLYFLWIFGDNIEDALGRKRFLILYAVALLAGGLLHLLTNTDSAIPLLGASGAIAGVMGAYIVLFPKVRVYVMITVLRINISVTWYLGFWILMQFGMAAMGGEGVAWMAHIGGFLAGVVVALLYRGHARYAHFTPA